MRKIAARKNSFLGRIQFAYSRSTLRRVISSHKTIVMLVIAILLLSLFYSVVNIGKSLDLRGKAAAPTRSVGLETEVGILSDSYVQIGTDTAASGPKHQYIQ